MSSGDYQTALCLKIVQEHFGIITRNVAKELFKHEVATLQLLVRVFQGILTPEQIKLALVVLMQHDCAYVEHPPQPPGGADAPSSSSGSSSSSSGGAGKGVNYRINSAAVINRLRHPSLLLIVREQFGDMGVFIMECFIEHGHISLPHLAREAIAARSMDANVETLGSSSSLASLGETDDETLIKEMRTTFEAMIQCRYICAVPYLVPRRSALQEQHQRVLDASSTRRSASNAGSSLMPVRRPGGPSSSSGVAFEGGEVTIKRKRAATPMSRSASPASFAHSGVDDLDALLPVELRVGMKPEEEEATMDFGDSAPAAKKLRNVDGIAAATDGQKKRVIADDSDDEDVVAARVVAARTPSPQVGSSAAGESSTSDDALWAINWDQYVRHKRHMLCVMYCRSRLGVVASMVCEVLLQYSMKTERDCCTKQSAPLATELLFKQFSATPGAPAIAMDGLRKLLDLMVQYNVLSANVMIGADQKYSVNVGTILDNLKQKTIHNVVCEKYGVQAGRIIEVLRHHKYVEQQQISDCAIVPAREAREKLYSLFLDKWVNYYEVSKSGSNTYNPSSTVYLWYYNNADGYNNSCNRTLIGRLYMVIYKLAVRYAHEIETGRTLVEVGQDTNKCNPSAAGASSSGSADTVELLQLRLNRLQRSIFEVADTLFLFEL